MVKFDDVFQLWSEDEIKRTREKFLNQSRPIKWPSEDEAHPTETLGTEEELS